MWQRSEERAGKCRRRRKGSGGPGVLHTATIRDCAQPDPGLGHPALPLVLAPLVKSVGTRTFNADSAPRCNDLFEMQDVLLAAWLKERTGLMLQLQASRSFVTVRTKGFGRCLAKGTYRF